MKFFYVDNDDGIFYFLTSLVVSQRGWAYIDRSTDLGVLIGSYSQQTSMYWICGMCPTLGYFNSI